MDSIKSLCSTKQLLLVAGLLATLAGGSIAANIQLVSVIESSSSSPASANGDSILPVVIRDNRFLLFSSTADNLVLPTNGTAFYSQFPPAQNVFLRDILYGTNLLISINTNGTASANDRSVPSALSTNLQFALFESEASNLTPNDTNNASDVFVRDLLNNITTLVSISTNGHPGNAASWNAVATPDGQFVAFVSAANDLVADDTNGMADVFVRDLQAGTTRLVSVGAKAPTSTTVLNFSDTPAISDDGRYVAFYSSGTNLVNGVNRSGEVYVRDLLTDTTTLASTDARTLFQAVSGSTNAICCNLRLSADGNYVAFQAVTNAPTGTSALGIILRYNMSTGLTDLIHTNVYSPIVGYQYYDHLDMTPDGRFVAFVANLTGVSGTNTAVYLWDAQTGSNTLVSANIFGGIPFGAFCDAPRVSSNGQFVAFSSTGSGLTFNPLSGEYHLYRRDVLAGTTTLVDINTSGVGAGGDVLNAPLLSADGSLVFFESSGNALVANDRNREMDIFMRDANAGTTTLISAHHPSMGSASPNGSSSITAQAISADGRFIAFRSDADNLVIGDTNQLLDVFVRDLTTGSNVLVSVSGSGAQGNGLSIEPAISGNGRFVAFTSTAANFFAGDANKLSDVFVRDLQTGTTLPVSVIASGASTANGDSYSPTISADGRYVLYRSTAGNLAVGSTLTGTENLFLRDRQLGTNYGLTANSGHFTSTMTADGRFVAFCDSSTASSGKIYVWDSLLARRIATNTASSGISTSIGISPDGNRVGYFNSSQVVAWNRVGNINTVILAGFPNFILGLIPGFRFSSDSQKMVYSLKPSQLGTSISQVYLYDFVTGINTLVSRGIYGVGVTNGHASSPDISADGRFVVYRCFANDLVAGDTNGVSDVFLYDSVTGINTRLSANIAGSPGDNTLSSTPFFSGNGRTLVFRSYAPNVAPNDFNHYDDVVAFQSLYATIVETNGINPSITWPAAPGKTFHVEYKNDLTDALWQKVAAPVTISNNVGSITDPSPSPGRRLYRVVLEN